MNGITDEPARKRLASGAEDQWVILFDFDNIKADPNVVVEAVRERGRVVLARAYGDAIRDQKFREVFLKANVEIIDRPRLNRADHRGNDIRMAIDAVEIALRHPNVTHFALVTGDPAFIPLVNRLMLYGQYVAVIGSKKNTSPKIIQASDLYLCYEDLVKQEALISDDFQTTAVALYRKAQQAVRAQGGPANANRIRKMIGRIDATFSWSEAGFMEFSDFLTWVESEAERLDERQEPRPGELQGREIHTFNLLLRALDKLRDEKIKATPARVRACVLELDPSFDEERMGFDSFERFLARMCETHKIQAGKTFVRLEPEFGWRRGLKKAQVTPHPRHLDAFLRIFEEQVTNLDEADTPSVGDMAGRVKRVLRVSNQKVTDMVRIVKASGALQPLSGDDYVTFNLPFRLSVFGEELRRLVLKGYLRRLAAIQSFKRTDFPLIARMLLGADGKEELALILSLSKEMVAEGRLGESGWTFSYTKRA